MKKYIYSILFILTFVGNVNGVFAQVSDMTLQRLMKNYALNRLDEYRAYHSMGDEETYFEFLDLFVNDSALVYNDQLGLGGKEQITVKEYADRQRERLQSPTIHFSNVKINRTWEDSGKWRVELSFNKSASYINGCGIQFSSMDFYGKSYEETAVLVFEEDMKTCKIESISGTIDSNRHLADDYLIFVSTSERDKDIKYSPKGGEKQMLEFNSFGQMMFEQGVKMNELSYSDPDVTLKPVINEDCHILQMQYKPRRWRLHAHFDLPIGDYYKFDTPSDKISCSSSGSEFGIDFGYTFPSKKLVKFSINMGLGIAMSKFDLEASAWNYSYDAGPDADIDGDSYKRHYEMGATKQSSSINHLDIPIYADADFCFNKRISAYIQLGMKNYMKISDNIKEYSSSDYVYGIYPQYDNLRLDEHWGYNGFGRHNVTLDNVKDPSLQAKGFTVDFFGGFGLRLKPFNNVPLAFELGMQYQMSLMDIIDTESNSFSEGEILSTYTNAGGEDTKLLSNGLNGMKRSHLKLNIGLVYKF